MLKKYRILTITLFALFLYGCDISDSNKSTVTDELSEEELEVAGQIIAESLSDQKDGIFASLNDAFSLPSSSNFTESAVEKGKYASPLFNAAMAKNSDNNANNYSYSYDPDTGIHSVNFSQSINNENLTKESTAELEYIYYDAEGAYIYSPRLDSDLIETIEYTGFRSGSIMTQNKNSSYERNDEFLIDGLTSDGPLTIEGLHEGSGEFKVTRGNGDVIERDYTLTVEFLDVQINSQTLSDGSLQKSVEGALAYEMMISKNLNGEESMKTVNGTIEFNGDGTALLRFQNILDKFKVTLEQGNLIDDNEFDGFVESVDTESEPQGFTLSDNQTYLFGTDTEIDSASDLATLEEIQAALEADLRIHAEGTFAENTDGAFIIQSVKFEYEDDDLEFEDTVESVDLESGIFTLKNGDVFNIIDETNFDEGGDLFSLEELLWALNNEYKVEAEGEFAPGEGGSNDVTEVKFEYDEKDFEFDDDVESADSEAGTFTLEDGNTYTIVDGTTTFHQKSDYSTLEEVITGLSEGAEIEAEGDYAPQEDGSFLVTKVKFESDEVDNDESDDPETDPFEGKVDSVNKSDKTIAVSGVTYHILQSTEFDDDIQSFGNLVGAFTRGDEIFVEGEFYNDGEKNIAVELEFEVERNEEDSDDDDDEEWDEFEFESNVSSVDVASQTFVLSSGLSLMINGDTDFDDSDINSLEELEDALNNGDTVEAEGEYYIDGADNIVTEVEFKVERRDDNEDDDEYEFGGRVNSVDTSSNSFELMDGQVYVVNGDTEFDDDGELFSLQEVADDLADGFIVTTEGEYDPQNDGTRLVLSVKFNSNRDDDDNGDDDDEREELEFEGLISSATSTSFTLDGQTFLVNGDTEIDGDVNTLDDVIDALNNGDEVEAEGEYYIDGGDNIVIEVEFEVDRDDDGDDQDDEDDEDREELEFEGAITSATTSAFTLDGETFTVNSETKIEGNNGINTLQDVMDTLNNGDTVEAEGEYYVDGSDNIVIEVEFEVERDDDGDDQDDEDDEDREELELEGAVTSATTSAFTIDGQTFTVNSETEIEGDNGINTLQDVVDALGNGDTVEAEGEYYVDGSDNIVIEVEFEVES